ncbi:MAG: SPASM domain-containing protein, partial [Desulfovibrionaceae bacterium]
ALFNKYCGVTIDYDEYVKQILYLDSVRGRMDLSAMYVDSDWSVEEKQLLRKRFEFLEDRLCGAVPFAWSKYDEHDFSMGAIDSSRSGISNKKVCPVPFYTICVNSDSTVSTCCVDWTHKTIVGNLEKESLYSIWKGEKLKDFQTMHLKGQRCLNEACAHCDYINFMKDNIDASAEAILKRL